LAYLQTSIPYEFITTTCCSCKLQTSQEISHIQVCLLSKIKILSGTSQVKPHKITLRLAHGQGMDFVFKVIA